MSEILNLEAQACPLNDTLFLLQINIINKILSLSHLSSGISSRYTSARSCFSFQVERRNIGACWLSCYLRFVTDKIKKAWKLNSDRFSFGFTFSRVSHLIEICNCARLISMTVQNVTQQTTKNNNCNCGSGMLIRTEKCSRHLRSSSDKSLFLVLCVALIFPLLQYVRFSRTNGETRARQHKKLVRKVENVVREER